MLFNIFRKVNKSSAKFALAVTAPPVHLLLLRMQIKKLGFLKAVTLNRTQSLFRALLPSVLSPLEGKLLKKKNQNFRYFLQKEFQHLENGNTSTLTFNVVCYNTEYLHQQRCRNCVDSAHISVAHYYVGLFMGQSFLIH